MKKYQDFLVESFNSKPVKWKREYYGERFGRYEFVINGKYYKVIMRNAGSDEYEVIFLMPDEADMLGMTGTGNQYLVLITVIDCIRDFVIQKENSTSPVNMLYFSATNKIWDEKIQGYKKLARPQVYERLIKKFLPNNYYIEEIVDYNDITMFHIKKNSK